MLKIFPIPTLKDNYTWAIQNGETADVAVVDCGEAKPVLDYLAKHSLNLTAILITHDHWDHTDGLSELIAANPQAVVFGAENVAQRVGKWATRIVQDNDEFELFGKPVKIIESHGHIEQHLSFLLNNEALFCGDELFSAGCGRTFTGNYKAHFEAIKRFRALPDFVQVYAGHEYTQSNLRFAVSLQPTNCALLEYQERVDILRSQNCPTLPSTIAVEKQINPFLQAVDLAEFTALRKRKDTF